MSELRNKIWDMHGKVSSLETWAQGMDEKLDTVIKAAANPSRKCNGLQKVEKILIGLEVLVIISLLLNPTTAALTKQVIDLVKAVS